MMINNIQLLRAFAAINVVIFHIIGTASSYSQDTSLFKFLQGWGSNGVDIFFVISGFVVLHSQIIKRKSPLEFFKARIIRIVPIYWGLTFIVVFLFLVAPSLFREMHLTPTWVVSSLLFFSFIFSEHPIIDVGWTLEWEVFFYLIFTVALFLKTWRAISIFISLALGFVALITKTFIIFEFLLGMSIACMYRYERLSKYFGFIIFLIGGFLLSLSLISSVRNFGLDRFFLWGIPSFFILLGAVYCKQSKNSILCYLGDASYSIYLIQIIAIPAYYKFSAAYFVGTNTDIMALECLVFTILCGSFMHSQIEKPLTIKLKSILKA